MISHCVSSCLREVALSCIRDVSKETLVIMPPTFAPKSSVGHESIPTEFRHLGSVFLRSQDQKLQLKLFQWYIEIAYENTVFLNLLDLEQGYASESAN